MNQVRIGIIGCGGIAERAHIPNLLAEPNVKLDTLSDTNEARLLDVLTKFNLPKEKSYTDYMNILEREDVDAVVIATPTQTHAEIALKAVKAGKHVFVEKPLSETLAEAESIVESSKHENVKVMVGYQHRFVPSHRIAKRYLRQGRIGAPFFGEVHSESLIVKPDEGILLDYGVHLIDLLCWYFDDSKIKEVAALSYMDETGAKEKHAVMLMRFSNGVLGRIGAFFLEGYTSWSASDRYVKILGARGKLVASLTGPTVTFYKEGSLMSRLRGPHTFMPRGAAHEKLPMTDSAYREEMHEFVQSILKDRSPSVDVTQGLMVQKVLDAVQRSITEKRFIGVDL
jgi:predicted dehydrogenase